VLRVIRRLLTRPECFRLEREFAGPDLPREGKCTLSRHTQQRCGKGSAHGGDGQKELRIFNVMGVNDPTRESSELNVSDSKPHVPVIKAAERR
jgi:hypothetical protein